MLRSLVSSLALLALLALLLQKVQVLRSRLPQSCCAVSSARSRCARTAAACELQQLQRARRAPPSRCARIGQASAKVLALLVQSTNTDASPSCCALNKRSNATPPPRASICTLLFASVFVLYYLRQYLYFTICVSICTLLRQYLYFTDALSVFPSRLALLLCARTASCVRIAPTPRVSPPTPATAASNARGGK